jgi:acyl carrier protein
VTHPARRADCLDVVVRTLGGQVGIDPGRIDPDRPLSAVPDIESVHVLRSITQVEEECSVVIPDDFLFETATVRELAEFIVTLMEQR